VTHLPIRRVEDDGTRVYAGYHRYKPMADADRKKAVRKPDDPRAVRFRCDWFLPLEVLPDEQRVMPQTRPDEEILTHRAWCSCEVCRRPEAQVLYRREARIRVRRDRATPGS
jgi:hypothetical protein